MFIETESTPNPATLKFLPQREIVGGGDTADFPDAAAATGRSRLAERLFALPGVSRVFLGADFVTVTKVDGEDWPALKPQVLAALVDHAVSGEQALEAGGQAASGGAFRPEDQEVVDQIKELLDTRVRPAVAADGGDIVFHGYEHGVVLLHMQGACSGCPSSRATLKHGIENMLRHYVPEVQSVEQVDL